MPPRMQAPPTPIHAVGGTVGALVTAIFADASVNGNLVGSYAQANGLAIQQNGVYVLNKSGLLTGQLMAMTITIVLSVVATAVIAMVVKALIGLRPSQEVESSGLDINEHGEEGYIG